jgi:hypothetical protein
LGSPVKFPFFIAEIRIAPTECVTNEHLSYDLLKGAWLDIPLNVRQLCVSRTMTKQSYYDLNYCISDKKPK